MLGSRPQDIMKTIEKISFRKLPFERLKGLKVHFGNKYQFKYLYHRLKSQIPVDSKIIEDKYLVLSFKKRRTPEYSDILIVMYDSTTQKFYVDTRPYSNIVDIRDVYRSFEYTRDVDHENIRDVEDGWIYRVQGDLVMRVFDENVFRDEIRNSLSNQLNMVLSQVFVRRLANLIRENFRLTVHTGQVRGFHSVIIPLQIKFFVKTQSYHLNVFTKKLGEIIRENLDFFYDIFDFCRRSGQIHDDVSVDVSEDSHMISLMFPSVDQDHDIVWIMIGKDKETSSITVNVGFRMGSFYGIRPWSIVEKVVNLIDFDTRVLNIGNHTVTLSNSSPNVFQVNVDLNLREIKNIILNVQTTTFLVHDSDIIVSHPEHGMRTLHVNGSKSVRFGSINLDIERNINTYIMKEILK
ncbi:MAG: hypothetical protein QXH21_09235 [Ignisphaera sp.]